MFNNYKGFHLVDTYHAMRHQRKYHPTDGTKRVVQSGLASRTSPLSSSASLPSSPLPR